MEALLRVISGPNVGACFVLEERTRLGRASDADIQLDEPHVSRHHARIRRQPDGSFELADLGSTAGTTINGAPVDKKVLAPDDVIAIGRSRFSFEMAGETTTAASFSNKARGFATLRPTQPMPVIPVERTSPRSAPPLAKRKRRRTTQRRIPAMRDSQPLAAGSPERKGEPGETLLDAILGPQTDVVVERSREAANEDSGPKVAAATAAASPQPKVAISNPQQPSSSSAPVAAPTPAVSGGARRTPPERPRTIPAGTPRGVPLTESGSVVMAFDPEAREAALSTLRDVLDYRALRLDGLRGQSMDARAKARFAQLTTRLLVDTHGLPSSRRFVREPCHLPATLTQCDGALSRTLEVNLDDLSAGGTRLSMFDPAVRVGDEVWVAFDLAALFSFGQKVVFRSRVVWTSGRIGATGLMFGGNAHFVETVEAAIATG